MLLIVHDSIQTAFNAFGIARRYRDRPSYDPDALLSTDQLSNFVNRRVVGSSRPYGDVLDRTKPPPWPWSNMSIWRMMSWKHSGGGQKSDAEITRLVKDVICADDFTIDDLKEFDASRESRRLDAAMKQHSEDIFQCDSWTKSSLQIHVPTREKDPNGNGRPFIVPNFMHRPITSVIKAAFAESTSKLFHLIPFKRVWKSPTTGKEQRIYDELYCSDAWLAAHDDLQKEKRQDGCGLERVIAGLMFWSDATHLAQFGQANAWPIYMFFGNLSKYMRASPSSGACHPIAFIPRVSNAPR